MPEVRLVGAAGEQVGIVGIEDALRMAMEADLDLVEVAPEAKPPVCKIMDYGKFKYEAAVKAREARKNQVNTVIKEMKLRPKIDLHDYVTKKGHIERFLLQGDKVKITIMFRGREQSRPELGYKLLQRLASDIGEAAVIESSPLQDGRNMTMVLAPARKGSGAKAAKPAPVVTPETANELALVYAFLSIADLAQFKSAHLTPLGRFYNHASVLEESARNTLNFEELIQRSEILQLESFSIEETATKKRRIELTPEQGELITRIDILETEHKNRGDIKKQKRLAFRLFDPKVDENSSAKEARTEMSVPLKKV